MFAEHAASVRRERIRAATFVAVAGTTWLAVQAPALLESFRGPVGLDSSQEQHYVRVAVHGLRPVGSHYKRDWLLRDIEYYTLQGTVDGAPELQRSQLLEIRASRWSETLRHGSFLMTGWRRPDPKTGHAVLDLGFSPWRFAGACAVIAFVCAYAVWRARQQAGREVAAALAECGEPAEVAAAIEAEAAEEGAFDETHRGGRLVVTRSWLVVLRTLSSRAVEVVQIGQVVDHAVRFHEEFVGNNRRVGMVTLTLRARRRRGALEVTLPLYQFEAMRTSFLGRLSEAQAAIRRQAQHVALDLFRAAVAANGASCGAVRAAAPLPECMGCSAAAAAVKIVKRCAPHGAAPHGAAPHGARGGCKDRRDCFCAPAWCCDCLGKWWLSSAPPGLQLSVEGEEVLSELAAELTATCPTCRVPFCVHDCVPVVAAEEEGVAR